MTTQDNLGELIKSALRTNKITQEQLADKLGVSRQTVNNSLSKSRIDKTFLEELKRVTGIDFVDYYDKAPYKHTDAGNRSDNHSSFKPVKWLMGLLSQLNEPSAEDMRRANELTQRFQEAIDIAKEWQDKYRALEKEFEAYKLKHPEK